MWQFAQSNPYLFVIIWWLTGVMAIMVCQYAFRAWNRTLRSRNVQKNGWPTPPIDADGDIVYPNQPERFP